ncbi:tankyrase-1 [Trichogramma pretiosum]|uniref:tankyrase-1 n=1 Tax=Trichogramma pretiosum TaxID=7493 RepID=UPI0006C967D0|nr:tankyrase-1 [Trichogramma pretiosum]
MAHPEQEDSLLKLKRLREQVDWTIEEQRGALLRQLMILFAEWSGPLPCLPEIFRPYEIDWLISELITKKMKTTLHKNRIKGFIEFVASTGYKESLIDQRINASELRTTPIHRAQRQHDLCQRADVTRELFKIYDRYDVNYTDEAGLTHFHVACGYGLVDACRNFLQLGHDPNCRAPPALDRRHPLCGSLLRLALVHGHRKVAEWLLWAGADPTRQDAHDGSTPLHVACAQREHDGNEMAEALLARCSAIQHGLLMEARDAWGRQALHLAAASGSLHSFGTLLSRGADPNALDSRGATPLHAICRRGDEEMARLLFSMFHRSQLRLDVRDHEGKTALNYAVASQNVNLSHLLLANGADARIGMEHMPAHVRRSMMQAAVSVQQYAAGAHGLPFGWLN